MKVLGIVILWLLGVVIIGIGCGSILGGSGYEFAGSFIVGMIWGAIIAGIATELGII